MRSDFYGLPYDVQQAIRKGEGRAFTIAELEARNASLAARIAQLEAALQQIALGEVGGDPDQGTSMFMACRKLALDALKDGGE